METWKKYIELQPEIRAILEVSIEDQSCNILFLDSNLCVKKLHFPQVIDLRYAIENAFIDRFANVTQERSSGVSLVENSDYIRYFRNNSSNSPHLSGLELQHYIIFDSIEVGLEILTETKPVLVHL